MSIADRLRVKFESGGFAVSPSGHIALAALAWYTKKSQKTIRNTLRTAGKWPRSERIGGSRCFSIDAILEWELARISDDRYPEISRDSTDDALQ